MTNDLRQQAWDGLPDEVKEYVKLQYYYGALNQRKLLVDLFGYENVK